MKKYFGLIFSLMILASKAFALDTASQGGVYLGFAGGVNVPASGWTNTTTVGTAWELFGAWNFDKNLGVKLDVDAAFYTKNNYDTLIIHHMLNLRYLADGNGVRPYFLGGPGLAYVGLTVPSFDTVGNNYFDFDLGSGVQFDISKVFNVSVEGKYNLIFLTGVTAQDISILVGLGFKLFNL